MDIADLDPGFSWRGVDRDALLLEAAERLDDLEGTLGPGVGAFVGPQESEAGRLARSLTTDVAKFGDAPLLYKLTEEYFASKNIAVPYDFKQLSQDYNFYWLDIPLDLSPKNNWPYDKIKVGIEFNPNAPKDGTRPRSYQILPDEQFRTVLEVPVGFEILLNGNFQFESNFDPIKGAIGPVTGSIGGGIGATATANAGIRIPPYTYVIKKAEITHSTPNLSEVRWSMAGHKFSLENKPRLSVIVQMLKGITELKVAGAMLTSRIFNYAPASFQEAIQELPRALKEFFTGGAVIPDETPKESPWDLTRFL